MASLSLTIALLLCLALSIQPVAAFGAGELPPNSPWRGHRWRHGDIASLVIANLPPIRSHPIKVIPLSSVIYQGNWLRDWSQFIDTKLLSACAESTIRGIVVIAGMIQLGYRMHLSPKDIGVYSHVEHIDNPRGYATDGKKYDSRLRGPCTEEELEINPVNGMKNYIAGNPKISWDTGTEFKSSGDYLRKILTESLHQFRSNNISQGFITLGAALHTLEDFSAHSNYVELCLWLLGETEVFPFVADNCRIDVAGSPPGTRWPPVVTGMFGSSDMLVSFLGEIDDHLSPPGDADFGSADLQSIYKLFGVYSEQFSKYFQQIYKCIDTISEVPYVGTSESLRSLLGDMANLAGQARSHAASVSSLNDETQSASFAPAGIPFDLHEAVQTGCYFQEQITGWLKTAVSICQNASFTYAIEPIRYIAGVLQEFTRGFIGAVVMASALVIRPAIKEMVQALSSKERDAKDKLFGSGTWSDPSHSLIAKDHYTNVLNNIAGKVAAVCTEHTVENMMKLVEHPEWNADGLFSANIEMLHNPIVAYYRSSPLSDYHAIMFKVVKDWWDSQGSAEKAELRRMLSKEGIRNGWNYQTINKTYSAGESSSIGVLDGARAVAGSLGAGSQEMTPTVAQATSTSILGSMFDPMVGLDAEMKVASAANLGITPEEAIALIKKLADDLKEAEVRLENGEIRPLNLDDNIQSYMADMDASKRQSPAVADNV